MPDPLGMTSGDFLAACSGRAKGGAPRALSAYRALFREGAVGALPISVAPIVRTLRSDSPEGEVIKFVQEVGAGHADPTRPARSPLGAAPLQIESVLIPMVGKSGVRTYTLCVSSQVGCAMGCVFCETAQMGLIRSLTAAEIVGQWYAATYLIGVRPKNIVFMGMGEPMDNLDHVIRAIAVLTDHNGPGVGMSRITVSTVGRLDGIARLGEQIRRPGWHRLNLAISVNAPNDAVRSAIMPINRAMPMAKLKEALLAWPAYAGTAICLEYVLIPGVNDSRGHTREIAGFAAGLRCCVNVIPYNPRRDSPWPAPREEDVATFLGWLVEAGVFCKRRRTKGRDMMGACGQLGTAEIRQRRFVEPTVSA